ncbi:MAG TPA: hypothetical protein VF152_03535 [Acidimicrobiia bacterium]
MTDVQATKQQAKGKLAIVLAAAAVLVVGVVVLIVGMSSASSADDDKSKAQTELDAARDDRSAATDELVAAVDEVMPGIEEARETIPIAEELCDCDGRITDVLDDMRAAAASGNADAMNAATVDLETEIDAANEALDRLRDATG